MSEQLFNTMTNKAVQTDDKQVEVKQGGGKTETVVNTNTDLIKPTVNKYKVNFGALNIRDKSSIESNILGTLLKNTEVEISEVQGEWGKLANRPGWVMLKYLLA